MQDPKDHELCAKRPGYEHPELRDRMREADEIWLVSSWNSWQVPHLPESLANIQSETDAVIWVIGRKNLGSGMSLKRYMREYRAGNAGMNLPMNATHLEVNSVMTAMLPEKQFVDISNLLCGAGPTCKNMTEGVLIAYDGSHLTQAGARYLGTLLDNFLEEAQ